MTSANGSIHPAVEYVEHGFSLVEIPRGSKGPKKAGWNKRENAITTQKAAAKLNGHNIGLIHEHSKTCAIDIDDLEKARPWLRERGVDIDALLSAPDAVQIVSGRANRAKLLYKLPKGLKLTHRKLADGALELRAGPVQDVLPPSIHPDTKQPYTWGGDGDWHNLPELPTELLALWHNDEMASGKVSPALLGDEIIYSLQAKNLYRKDDGHGKHLIACPWAHEHTTNGGAGETAYFQAHTNGYQKAAFKCFHAHCAERTIGDLRVYLGLEQTVPPGEEVLMQRRYTPDELLADAVYLSKRDTITLLSVPRIDCTSEHFRRLLAASTEYRLTPNGSRPKNVNVSDLWLAHPNRKTAVDRTFSPGEGPLCDGPEGEVCVNTWRPIAHEPPKNWRKVVKPFLDHLAYLIPDTEVREQFVLWLAHLIQRPGDMPPWHTLMCTDGAQGVGRNWLAAVIGKLLRGYAALHVDISALAGTAQGSGYNGVLAGKIFACVDELHASAFAHGGRRMMETLKTTLTADTRLINPKYGKQTVEFNRTRVLILSNHIEAMPLDVEDRRFLVVRNPDEARTTSYYIALYALLNDDAFISSVWQYLDSLELTKLTLGRAPVTAAKAALIEATEPEHVTALRELVERIDKDLLTTPYVKGRANITASWQLRDAMKAIGAVKYPRRVRIGSGRQEHVWVVRNQERWLRTTPDAVVRYFVSEPDEPVKPDSSGTIAKKGLVKKFLSRSTGSSGSSGSPQNQRRKQRKTVRKRPPKTARPASGRTPSGFGRKST